jgi:flagella basal body P-ring formation protein FlgA
MVPVDLPPEPPAVASLIAWVEETCNAARVEVAHLGVANEVVAEGDLHWSGDPCRERPRLRVSVVKDGVLRTELSLRPALSIWMNTPVATHTIAPGQPVSTAPGVARMGALVGEPLLAEGPWTAKISIDKGEPVSASMVQRPLDLTSGQAVSIRVTRGAIVLSAPGRLLQDARIGDRVVVANEATRTTVRGVLISADLVEVLP